MNLDPLLALLRSGLGNGVAVDRWSIYASDSSRFSLGIKDRQVGNAHAPLGLVESSAARYLIVWDDGLVSRGSFERGQYETRPDEALVAARAAAYSDPDAAQVMGPSPIPDVELHDETVAAIARGDAAPISARLDRIRARAEDGFRTWSGSFGATDSTARLVTSAGLDTVGRGTTFGWHVTLDGEIGDGFGARACDSETEFETRLERLAETARRLRVKARPSNGGILPVILHPGVVESLVLGNLLHHLDGATIDHGESRFRRDQFDSHDLVLREDLSLRLDPLQPLKSGSYRVSAEGVPAARCTFIDNGKLIQPVLDLKYSKRLGLPPTPLPYSSDALRFEGSDPLPLASALGEAVGGALILSVLGLHTQDPSSGDFSLSAPQALAIGPEGFAGGMRATLSGNVFDVLRDDSLRQVRFEGETTPGLLFACRLDPR